MEREETTLVCKGGEAFQAVFDITYADPFVDSLGLVRLRFERCELILRVVGIDAAGATLSVEHPRFVGIELIS